MSTTLSPKQFGAIGDGKTDDTQAFLNALIASDQQGIPVQLDDTHYIINGWVNIPGKAILTAKSNSHLIETTQNINDNLIFAFANAKGAKILGINFKMPSNNTTAIVGYGSDGCVIDGGTVQGGQLFNATGPFTNFQISNYNVSGSDRTQGSGLVNVQYCVKGIVKYLTLKNGFEGIQWWGGDSAPDHPAPGGPFVTSPHPNSDIEFCYNKITNINGGGIWGSLGERMYVHDNDISFCYDVGIDPEGTINSIFDHNSVTDCQNSNFSTFFYESGNVFSNNYSHLTGKMGNGHFRVFNGAPNSDPNQNLDVTLNSNVFDGPGQIGQDHVNTIKTDGKNVLMNGAYQAWTDNDVPFSDKNTAMIAGVGARPIVIVTPPVVTPPVVTPPVVTPPVTTPPTNSSTDAVAEAKLLVDEAKLKADEALITSMQAQQKLDEARELAAEARITAIEARFNKLKSI